MQTPNINAINGTLEERLQDTIAGRGARAFPIPVAFFVVDAGFLEYFTEYAAFTDSLVHRVPLTTGSVEYQFQGKKEAPLAAIVRIRAISSDVTQIALRLGDWSKKVNEDIQQQMAGTFMHLLLGFDAWMFDQTNEANNYKRLNEEQDMQRPTIPPLSTSHAQTAYPPELQPKRPGRPSPQEDEWAWEQVNIEKRPREVVRGEWTERMSEKRRNELRDIKRSFRHATDPERRRKE